MANEGTVVTVNVSLAGGGVTRPGFGKALLLSNTGNAWGTPELTREYTKDSFSADFASTTAEYQALTAFFAQPIKPTSVLVGKGTHKPTRIIDLSLNPPFLAGVAYKANVYDKGALQSVTYTTVAAAAWVALTVYAQGDTVTNDTGKLYVCITGGTSAGAGGPTGTAADITDGTVHWMYAAASGTISNDTIAYNLLIRINALAAPALDFTATLTGSVNAKIVVLTGNATGNWFSIEPIASGDTAAVSNLMAVIDVTTDPGIATDLDAIYSANPSWYALLLLFQSSAIVTTPSTGAAAWAQGKGRLLLVSTADTAAATSAFPGSDMLDVLADAGQSYVAGMWHPRDYEWFAAAKDGYFLPLTPGSDNWCNKTYGGVTPVNLTPTQQANLNARRAAFYFTRGGVNVDGGIGQVEDPAYGFIDNRRNIDDWATNLADDLLDLEYKNNKVANTNAGRRKIDLVIRARNDAAIVQGIISPDPLDPTNAQAPIMDPYTVFVPPVSDATSFNTGTRALTGVTTVWKLAGAIDSITVNANVSE